jgi:methyltransferase (TIGR00027 family)
MMNPISKTAYYTLGVRAWDAALPNPICSDSFAKIFMNDDAQKIWKEFKDQSRPNMSNAARHAIIDNQLRTVFREAPDSRVVIVGAGFDTRAYRIKGGKWIELDEPAIIEYKEGKLPTLKCPNALTRIPIEFTKESLIEKLRPYASQEVTHIIIEGVLMYLTHGERQKLVSGLQELFPRQIVYCDLMHKSFFDRYSKELYEKIRSLGASFKDMVEQPEDIFLGNSYKMLACTSVPLYAVQHGKDGLASFIIRYFLKTLREGYRICRFEYIKSND